MTDAPLGGRLVLTVRDASKAQLFVSLFHLWLSGTHATIEQRQIQSISHDCILAEENFSTAQPTLRCC